MYDESQMTKYFQLKRIRPLDSLPRKPRKEDHLDPRSKAWQKINNHDCNWQ